MKKAKKLSNVTELIVQAYTESELTLDQIKDMYNCSAGTVRQILINSGAQLRGPGRRKGTKNKEKVNNGVQ